MIAAALLAIAPIAAPALPSWADALPVFEQRRSGARRSSTRRKRGAQLGAVAPAALAGTYYPNCAAARAAGAAPIRAGSAGYSRKLDRDGDGVACE